MPIVITGLDISHYQGAVDFSKLRAAGREFVVIKATEGTSYLDPQFATYRQQAHAAGLVVGFYHFARAGAPAAEAAWFLKTVGALQAGEFLVLDWEVPAPAGTPAPVWCKAWLDAVHAATGVAPLIYMNSSAMTGSNWSAVAAGYGLWLAKYDQSTAAAPTSWWPTEAMKQSNDKTLMVGVVGGVDDDVFYGTREQLLAYGYQGAVMTAVDLTPAAVQAITNAVWTRAIKNPTRVASAEVMLANADSYANTSVFAIRDAVAAAVGKPVVDVQAIASAVLAGLTDEQAKAVADQVLAKLAAKLGPAGS